MVDAAAAVPAADLPRGAERCSPGPSAALGANWTLHDLRHTAAYRMARDPDDADDRRAVGPGARPAVTTQLYVTPLPEDVIASVLAHHARRAGRARRAVRRRRRRVPARVAGRAVRGRA